MLRRMENTGQGALGLRRMDWEGAARLGRRALGLAALAGAMLLLCHARAGLVGGEGRLAPFAMAFCAAALATGRNTAALLIGCLVGALRGTLADFDLRLPIGAAVVLGGSLAWDGARPALERTLRGENGLGRRLRAARGALNGRRAAEAPAPNRLARSPNEAAVCAALAGAGALLPGLILTDGPLWPGAVEATAASVAAVAAAPFFRAFLAAGSRRMGRDARIGGRVLLGLLCMGLARLSPPAACCAGAGLTLLMAPSGGLAGIGFGGALAAATGDARLLALMAVCGATAQLCAATTRPTRNLAASGALLAAGLLMNLAPAALAGALLSTVLTLPMPEEWARFFLLLCASPAEPARQAALARRRAAARVSALAAAFAEAEGDAALACARQALEALAESLAAPEKRARPALRVERGMACAPREAGAPSGDSCLFCRLDETRQLALVSDGMGSGAAAARESASAARLLARLMRAGASLALAAEAANALMLERGGEDMFATADALVIDLATGEAEFMKLAACPTLVLRDGRVLRVAGGRLPLGILEGVRPQVRRARLLAGDAALLVSDGVLDALGEPALAALLADSAQLPAEAIAARVLEAAERAGGPGDDKTALCLKLGRESAGRIGRETPRRGRRRGLCSSF